MQMRSRSTIPWLALLLVLSAARVAVAAEWVPVGLPSTTVSALAAAPSDPRVVYAATWGSGVYRSTDGGRSWTRRNGAGATGLADYNVLCLAVDPRNPATVYAGTNQAGIFKTSDGGATWSLLPTGVVVPHLAPVEALAVDPVRPGTVYATYSIFLIKSTDGGAHWTRSGAGLEFDSNTVTVDPRVPRTLYAGMTGNGVYKSVNGGASWAPANRGIENASIYRIAVDPRNRNRLYAFGYKDPAIQLFTSADGGLTWRASNRGLPAGARLWTVEVDASGTAYAGTENGVYKSLDGGARWRPANQGTAGLLVGALAAHPQTAGVLWAGTGRTSLAMGTGVYRTTNGGGTWTAARRGMTGGEVSSLAAGRVPPGGEPALYAGTPVQGVFGRPEGRADWVSLRGGNSEAVLVDPENPDVLYTAGNGGVFRSAGRGATWVARNQGLASGGTVPKIFALAFNAADSGILYAGGSQAIYKSADGGATWRRTSFVVGTRVESFGTSAGDPAVLYATGRQIDIVGNPGLFMKSTDGGETWTPLTAFSVQQRLAADPTDAGTVLIADNGTLTRSGDGGATFEPISFEGPAGLGCTAVVFDPTAPGVAYAAFFASGRQPATFVFQSLDGGVTWEPIEAPGIGSSFVLNLTVDDTGTLYAATRGGGIYKLELP